MQLAKRLLTLSGVVVLAIGLAGCPQQPADEAADAPPQPPITEQPGEPAAPDATEGDVRTVVLNAQGMH